MPASNKNHRSLPERLRDRLGRIHARKRENDVGFAKEVAGLRSLQDRALEDIAAAGESINRKEYGRKISVVGETNARIRKLEHEHDKVEKLLEKTEAKLEQIQGTLNFIPTFLIRMNKRAEGITDLRGKLDFYCQGIAGMIAELGGGKQEDFRVRIFLKDGAGNLERAAAYNDKAEKYLFEQPKNDGEMWPLFWALREGKGSEEHRVIYLHEGHEHYPVHGETYNRLGTKEAVILRLKAAEETIGAIVIDATPNGERKRSLRPLVPFLYSEAVEQFTLLLATNVENLRIMKDKVSRYKDALHDIKGGSLKLVKKITSVLKEREGKSDKPQSELETFLNRVASEVLKIGDTALQAHTSTNREFIPLSSELSALLDNLQRYWDDSGERMEREIQPGVIVCYNYPLLRSNVGELVRNAIKYADLDKKEKILRITLKQENGFAKLTVWDNGRGIPADELAEIGTEGNRASNASAHGTGTGLAVMKEELEANRGRFEIKSVEGEWTEVSLYFPL